MKLIPITFRTAKDFVSQHHRHHKSPQGHKFSIGAEKNGKLVGVVIAGRPVSRHMDDGTTLEIIRTATDGTFNACSILIGAARKAGKAMGYTRFITYTLLEESGASLRGAGWEVDNENAGGGTWNSKTRSRTDKHPLGRKIRWISK